MKDLNDQDDIVISGISGTFPTCRNVHEFESNLYNKVNMVNDDESRWKHTNPLIPKLAGNVPEINKFDSTFFGINHAQANNMDPQSRMLIEEAFKAIMDAGVNPRSLRGSNTGVYIGNIFSDSQKYLLYDNTDETTGFGLIGGSKAMIANRISFIFGITGPSLTCDTACSSSLTAFNLAYNAFKSREIDSAIVGAANLTLHPHILLQFSLLGVCAFNSHSSPFDEAASGYIRSEAVSCVFLQRRYAAKRVYATAMQCAINSDGFKSEGITFPSRFSQEKLMKQIYDRANIDINDLGYFEAHCTGTAVGDPEECAALDKAICKHRNKPLLVGSVKSNCGHTEATSGLCGLIKAIFAFENNIIPPNINFENPNKKISAIQEGRMQVVTEPTVLTKPYIGINSFGFGGANGHLILRQFERQKMYNHEHMNTLPRLVTWSSRTEENCNEFFSYLANHPLDEEFLALAKNSQLNGIQGMVFRGYSILKEKSKNKNPVVVNTYVQHNRGIRRPLVWVFSGMGSQWPGMGKTLLQLPFCRESIKKSHDILLPMGIDLVKIITSDDPHILENIIYSFVGIAAIQIALVDLLKELHITPDLLIGHSVGELGCAYADNCLTAEQMILASYYCGKVSLEVNKITGSMAAIGLGYKDIMSILPDAIDIACHNSSESCIISGPDKDIMYFVASLTPKNIFTREVQCSHIAYHSRYISHFGSELLKHLKKIITKPSLRSSKWICTSVPQSQWILDENKYSSAEYHTNNFLKSVFFEEGLTSIPKNALTVEIAPHAVLQSILQNDLSDGVHIGLTEQNAQDGGLHFLNALGSLYVNGLEIHTEALYPKVNWPVSRGTPNLSSLVQFDHSRNYFVYKYDDSQSGNGIKTFYIRLADQKYQYLAGHEIDGRILIPAAFYLECVWDTFAGLKGSNCDKLSVELRSVQFVRATTININYEIELNVLVHKGTGKFEVTESNSLVATGYIQVIVGKMKPTTIPLSGSHENHIMLEKKDLYKEFKLRGYDFNCAFQSIDLITHDGLYAKTNVQQNWVILIDSMLQLNILHYDTRSLLVPTKIRTLRIDPQYHKYISEQSSLHEIFYKKLQNKTICGGIEIDELVFNTVQRKKGNAEAILEKYQFVSHFPAPKFHLDDAARCCLELVQENLLLTTLQIVEFPNIRHNTHFLLNLKQVIPDLPQISAAYALCYKSKELHMEEIEGVKNIYLDKDDSINPHIVVMSAEDLILLKTQILMVMSSSSFLIIREKNNMNIEKFNCPVEFVPIAFFPTDMETFVLLQLNQKYSDSNEAHIVHVSSSDDGFEWLPKLQEIYTRSNNIILVSQNEKFSGILGLTNCLRKELANSHIQCILIDDPKAPVFDPDLDLYKNQLKLNLPVNVYQNGEWGTYRHLRLEHNCPTSKHSNHVFANILRIGDMCSLRWIEGRLKNSDINVKIVYSSLNFRDIMNASGRIPLEFGRIEQDCVFGLEYSGIEIKTGKFIMGMTPKAAIGSHLKTNALLTWEVPREWSLSEAATVPVVYVTVYYAFFFTVNIRKGKSILIHAGSGGVGIAAINIALAYGLEVYTTVSTAAKKTFLLKTFPSLKESHIGNSRDTSFEAMIKEETDGEGVDFVLNSLSETKLLASVRCLGKRGHFIEIGKFDIVSDNSLPLDAFLNEISFHAVIADSLYTAPKEFVNDIKDMMNKDIEKGIIKPLPATIFKAHEIEQAFRYLASGKHIGKVMIQIRESPESDCTLPISVLSRIYFSSNSTYVILGGLGGIGLEFVDWMILRGARKIVLSSRRGITNGYQKLRISLWRKYSCQVVINTSNIGTETGCLQLINDAMTLGPIRGIFNLAAVIKDGVFFSQTKQNFEDVFQSKVLATKYLDQISRKLCPDLEHFVIYSSISCGRGVGGQTNYGMANSIMERIIEDRVAHGLPGKAIQWGPVKEVGLLAEMLEVNNQLEIGGGSPQNIRSCLEVLDALLSSTDPIVCSIVVAQKTEINSMQTLTEFILNMLDIRDINTISMASTLPELGMDSLVAIEIKQILERDYNIVLSIADIRTLTIDKLKELSGNVGEVSTNHAQYSDDCDANFRLLYYHDESNFICPDIFDHVNDIFNGPPIIIFPGIDGYSNNIWRTMGRGLKYPTYVLQQKSLSGVKNMEDIVRSAYENTVQILKEKGVETFQILAYSYGSMIAEYTIELLENAGYIGKAIFIDGSVKVLQVLMDKLKNVHSEDDAGRLTLSILLNIMIPQLSSSVIEQNLRQLLFTEDMILFARQTLLENEVGHVDNLMDYIETIMLKIKILYMPDAFKAIKMLQSKILLLKPITPIVSGIDENYGISSVTAQTNQSELLDGNHQTILQNNRIVAVINKFFD